MAKGLIVSEGLGGPILFGAKRVKTTIIPIGDETYLYAGDDQLYYYKVPLTATQIPNVLFAGNKVMWGGDNTILVAGED